MDYVNPVELVQEALRVAKKKAALSTCDLLLRGFLAGAFLAYATSLVMIVLSQGLPPIVGALLFPVGFVMLVLLGLELATGNFALLPAALAAGEVSLGKLLRNWGWVYLGNVLGSVFYAALFYLAVTNCGASAGGPLGDLLKQTAQRKTLAYMALGGSGWTTALVKGILCNWMVTIGAVLAMVSRSTVGKVVAMWLPIMTFFAHGYEHSIVNMFVIPAGMLFGAPVSVRQWWLWNQIPVTLGNIVSGALLTGLALYVTFRVKQTPSEAAPVALPQRVEEIKLDRTAEAQVL
ncbi:MAG: formate transporter [Acidobacteria bacterium]|nr:MAG: formate transporter [Acidobacteriota bacterium]